MTSDWKKNNLTIEDFDTYPNFPSLGILFYDISPILADRAKWNQLSRMLVQATWGLPRPQVIAGIDARGFIVASMLAESMAVGLTMIRKKGKLPGATKTIGYNSEYSSEELEINGSFVSGKRVWIVDDVLATGETMQAARNLVSASGGEVAGLVSVLDLGICGYGDHSLYRKVFYLGVDKDTDRV